MVAMKETVWCYREGVPTYLGYIASPHVSCTFMGSDSLRQDLEHFAAHDVKYGGL